MVVDGGFFVGALLHIANVKYSCGEWELMADFSCERLDDHFAEIAQVVDEFS